MAHIGRTVKNVEAPRPLKSQSRSSLKNNFMLIEELIQLIENVALTLQSGINNMEPMATLVQNLRIHGPQLESVSKDTLDRAFVVFRNASQDERLNLMTRLNLLQLIELRAKGWEDNGSSAYYKTKQATNIEIPEAQLHHQHHSDVTQAAFLSTSPTFGAGSAALAAAVAAVGSAQQQQLLLGPGELIRNSGKFPKPTKIPGKTYCKDEVVIRNADSGKVMGIKGRRVHMIEELSETIISFQRVNPGAKERLVQITGPSEDKINYAKQLIEDTIRRNASPVRLDPAMGTHAGGSCSSLASSNSDEATPRPGAGSGTGGGGGPLANRLSLNSAQNFMTASAAVAAQQVAAQQASVAALLANTQSNAAAVNAAVNAAGNAMRPNQQMLLHSYSTNDASLGEYKYTVNVGQHLIKITGDCCDLVRVAKLVLDDYFSSAEFLASVEAGAAFDGSIVSPMSTPSTPMAAPPFMMGNSLQMGTPLADSGIGLNYMAGQIANNANDGDDDVFVDANGLISSQNNGLARSRRSHFSRKDSTPEAVATGNTAARFNDSGNAAAKSRTDSARIVHEYEHLLYYAKSPHSWALPADWQKICEKYPAIVRNKVTHVTTNATTIMRVANTTTTTTNIGTSLSNSFYNSLNINNSYNNNGNNNNSNNNNVMKLVASPSVCSTVVATTTTMPSSATSNFSLDDKSSSSTTQLNIRRKGFFNRQTYSIDEEGYTAELMLQQQQYPVAHQQHHHHHSPTRSSSQKSQNPNSIWKELTITVNTGVTATAATPTYTTAAVNSSSSSDLSLVKSSTESLNNNNFYIATPTAHTPNHSVSSNNSNSNNSSQKNLLNKQIKLITAITEKNDGKKSGDLPEYSILNEDEPILIEDSTDEEFDFDDDVVNSNVCGGGGGGSGGTGAGVGATRYPKFQREYRSNSTCN